jgi:CHAD domain-containing protein
MKIQVEPVQTTQKAEESLPEKEKFVDLPKYFKKRIKKINGLLDRGKEALVQETIHELRVEIKKINALFDLLTKVRKRAPAKKYAKPFNRLFKKAGKLRSIQVEFNLINDHFTENTNSSYLHELHEIKHKRRIGLEEIIDGNLKEELDDAKKNILPHLERVRKRDIIRYFNSRERDVIDLLKKKFFREQDMHVIRKNLKQFYLNIKNITPYKIDAGWANILELMGEWHDRQVAFDQLTKAIYSSDLSTSEMDRLQKVKSEILTEKNNLYEQIVAGYANQNKMYLIE